MKCRLCGKAAYEIGGYLKRVNEFGITGMWECAPSCSADRSFETNLLDALDCNVEEYITIPDEVKPLVEFLWQIIDDIDTYGDWAKDNDKAYRAAVEKRQKDRWNTGITTDGLGLNFENIKATKQE
jgi:hypothetical protein